jgi:flagellar hook capping protein FlgD
MGGAFVTWQDLRDDATTSYDVYAQHVLSSGAVDGVWPTNGRALCTAAGVQGAPTIIANGSGGIIVAWEDHRGADFDIYALGLNSSGTIVGVAPEARPARLMLVSPYPNPASSDRVTVRLDLPTAQEVSAEVLDIAGHRVRTLALDRQLPAGRQTFVWDGRDGAGASLPGGIYFIHVRTGVNADTRRIVLLR